MFIFCTGHKGSRQSFSFFGAIPFLKKRVNKNVNDVQVKHQHTHNKDSCNNYFFIVLSLLPLFAECSPEMGMCCVVFFYSRYISPIMFSVGERVVPGTYV